MSIARYTQQMMTDLEKLGRAECNYTFIGEVAARSRLQNAARRLGIRITTKKQDGDFIQATVKS